MADTATRGVQTMLGEPRRAVLSMVVPVFIALLIGYLNTLVDSVWCSSLGVNALSAINLVSSLYFVVVGIGNGVGVGLNVAISRRIGAGDKVGAEKCASQTFLVMILFSLPLIPILYFAMGPLISVLGGDSIMTEAKDYLFPIVMLCPFTVIMGVICGALRGEGAVRLSTIINVSAALINMVLDPVFIFILDLGLFGASLATMTATIIAVAIGWYAYHSGTTYIRIRRSVPEKEVLSDVAKVGIPQAIELDIMALMNFFLIYFVMRCGGTEGLAVYATPWRIITLAVVPAEAVATAMVPVCSSAVGQRDPGRLKDAFHFTTFLVITLGVLMAFILWITSGISVLAFTYSDSMAGYRDAMAHVLRIYVLFVPFYGLIYVGSSMLSSLTKSGYSLMSSFLRNVLLIAMYAIASYHTMEWIYWSVTVGEIIGGSFMLALAYWQFGRKYRSMTGVTAIN